jgi:small subunit ribosomal protein S17e
MDRVRRISEEILKKFPTSFGSDYQANKEELGRVAILDSKMLRNKIAGYITKINSRAEAAAEAEVVVAETTE